MRISIIASATLRYPHSPSINHYLFFPLLNLPHAKTKTGCDLRRKLRHKMEGRTLDHLPTPQIEPANLILPTLKFRLAQPANHLDAAARLIFQIQDLPICPPIAAHHTQRCILRQAKADLRTVLALQIIILLP